MSEILETIGSIRPQKFFCSTLAQAFAVNYISKGPFHKHFMGSISTVSELRKKITAELKKSRSRVGIKAQGQWVRSGNAIAVLCSPPLENMLLTNVTTF